MVEKFQSSIQWHKDLILSRHDYFHLDHENNITVVDDFGTLQPVSIEQLPKVGLFLSLTLPHNYFYK